jgi:hypothetical protein
MQYALLVYGEEQRWAKMPQAQQDQEMAGYREFGKEFGASIKAGDALQPSGAATTVRIRNGKRLTTDGPFAETKEQLGGFYVVEARDLDAAIAMAAKIPGASAGSVEVRPVMKFS